MKYVIDLKKDGILRGQIVRSSEEEARAIASEYAGRGCGNSADWHAEENLRFAIYFCGDLDRVVTAEEFDEMKESGCFDCDAYDWALVDGEPHKTLSEAFRDWIAKTHA